MGRSTLQAAIANAIRDTLLDNSGYKVTERDKLDVTVLFAVREEVQTDNILTALARWARGVRHHGRALCNEGHSQIFYVADKSVLQIYPTANRCNEFGGQAGIQRTCREIYEILKCPFFFEVVGFDEDTIAMRIFCEKGCC